MPNSVSNRLPLLLILITLALLITYLMWPHAQEQKEKFQRVISVNTVLVSEIEFKDVVEAIGTARANEQVLITSKYSDLVDDIYFEDGQLVEKNDVLVKLNHQEEAAKVKELQANLEESVAQLNRFQDLLKKKATSKSLVDQQEAKTKAISAQLLSAKTKYNDLTIKAPFSGILGFRQISVGAYIDSGDVITSLDDLSKIKVDFTVPERFITSIAIGQVISARNTAYGELVFQGKVTSISSRVDTETRTLQVRAEIPNQSLKLRAGMLLNVLVERSVDTVLHVPESAVIPVENKHFVYTVVGDEAKKIEVNIGRRQPGIVEILSGINQGEQVVVEGALKLRDGIKVKVLENKA